MSVSNSLSQADLIFEQRIAIVSTTDIVRARQTGRDLAAEQEFSRSEQTRFATAISELTRNVLTYAGEGHCYFTVNSSQKRTSVRACISDNGPGIQDINLALQDGYSGGNGLGLGLPGAKRLVHSFSIHSVPGETVINIAISRQKWS